MVLVSGHDDVDVCSGGAASSSSLLAAVPRGWTAQECSNVFGYEFVGDPDAIVSEKVVRFMQENPVMEQRTPEWFAARRRVITASDMAAAIGENIHKSTHMLLMDKCDLTRDKFTGNEATQHGQKYEPVALDLFCKETKKTVFEFGMLTHPYYRFIGGSPDGVCADGSLLEIKCPLYRVPKHEVPVYYLSQLQICMEILDSDMCYFVQYVPPELGKKCGEIFDILEVKRSKKWFSEKLPIIREFWKDVLFYRAHSYELHAIDAKRKIMMEFEYTIEKKSKTCMIKPGMYDDEECKNE